jgi:pyridoxine kinase
VSESVIPIYKSLMPKATCATPNYFEAELLTGVKIVSASSLLAALKAFHDVYRIPHAIISSVSLPASELALLGFPPSTSPSRQLVCAGSSLVTDSNGVQSITAFGIAFPELHEGRVEHYTGVGDVFSALVLARFPPHPSLMAPPSVPVHPISPLARTAELAIASLQGILANTRAHALVLAQGNASVLVMKEGETPEERVRRSRMVELRLVQSQKEILDPVVAHHAVRFY